MSGIERDPLALCEPEAPRARTVPIKVNPEARCSLAPPLAEPGEQLSGAIIWHVLDCPPEVTAREVLELFGGTVVWCAGVYRVRFAELGPGRLARHPIEADPLAWAEP